MNRLFIALKMPVNVVEQIDDLRKSIYDYDDLGRWEPKDKLHLTLKFLGDTEERNTATIINKLEAIVSEYSRFECSLGEFGFFLPKTLWIKLIVKPALFTLVKEIEESLIELGFEKEKRSFKPHITLLRIKKNVTDEIVSGFKNFKVPETNFYCDEIALVKSELLPRGSKYTDIKVFKLS
ncbi:MAG: RNA 2',3'-cyclic phosphodiesterase [Ignavibacteriales bacterium]|nr:MAG: RNA 2',3'-cyclic phosphodiesterase [Ignavibacteriales bacterium]